MGKSRKAFLKGIVEEYLDMGVGAYGAGDVIDKLLEEGHITEAELAKEYGRAGFKREIVDPVTKMREADGRDRYMPTKQKGWLQRDMSELEDCVFTYYARKRHLEGVEARLDWLRRYIQERFDVDPEDLSDPTGGAEDEDA